jgi:hypothetical protein
MQEREFCYIMSLRLTVLLFQSQLWLSFGDSSGRPSCYAWTGGRGYMLVEEVWVGIVRVNSSILKVGAVFTVIVHISSV